MASTILIVGATGNTGRSVVETLSNSINTNQALAGYRIIALTRSSESPVAQKLAQLPNVTIEEKNWVGISPDWLRERNVVKAFIASHNEPSHFADESTFHLAALHAGVKYVVRISTTAANVHPDYPAYYPRQHWAIEALLSSPEFEKLQWTSLQPNVFTTMVLGPAIEFIKQYRKDGKQGTLALMADEDARLGCVHPDDVGRFAAVLLSQEDHSVHNKAKYVLNGPEDITGKQIVKLVEQHIGTPIKNVIFRDVSFIDTWADSVEENKSLILSIKTAPVTAWEGKCSIATTSKEVNELAAPQIAPAEWLKSALLS
ncbi:NmrA-like family protein [Sclerotinia borealis F-4128]|uniref:NmrA-like family protein n=1 Tax=Sclerotinia borealis (strain F-4128) TaxID=1432307 RepID=W9C7S0_SCLBF|nr:NmrA-like family protein [Sclerotinia borealis F-4128]